MNNLVKIAVCQFKGSMNKLENINKAKEFVSRSIDKGSKIIVLPECFAVPYEINLFSQYSEKKLDSSPSINIFRELTKDKSDIYIFAGSIIEEENNKLYNTCFVYNNGNIIGSYRKNNLYKINLKEHSFSEEAVLSPGLEPTIIDTIYGKIGIGICYDLRFPKLAKYYQENGCKLIIYPGSFNRITGPVHWKLLQQARAIDNQLFVISCSAASNNEMKFKPYGKSFIISPWGAVISETQLDSEEEIVKDIDLNMINEIRNKIPILEN